jgi:hypothetical protein
MIVYVINKNMDVYEIRYDNEIIFTAKRKSLLFKEVIYFFKNDKMIVEVVQNLRWFGFSIPKIFFCEERTHSQLITKKGFSRLVYSHNEYCIKNKIIGYNPDLFVNEKKQGEYKYIKGGINKFTAEIICDKHLYCYIFSVIIIALNIDMD